MSPSTHLFVLISLHFRLSVCQLVCIYLHIQYLVTIYLSPAPNICLSLFVSIPICVSLSVPISLRLCTLLSACVSLLVLDCFCLFSSLTTLPESLFFYTQRLRNIGYLPTIDSSLKIYTQFLNSCYNLFSETLITFSTKSKC